MSIPIEIMRIEGFLEQMGLKEVQNISGEMGNQIIQYEGVNISVRLFCDRGTWFIEIGNSTLHPDAWAGMSLIRNVLLGSENDSAMPLSSEFEFLQVNWREISDRFSPAKAAETHAQLRAANRAILIRRFPKGLPDSWYR